MDINIIKRKLKGVIAEHQEADVRAAVFGMLGLAAQAEVSSPDAAFVWLQETDQDDSGELWVQGMLDAERNEVADLPADAHEFSTQLGVTNAAVWQPFMVVVNDPTKRVAGEYLLDLARVRANLSTPDEDVYRLLDLSTAHLPEDIRHCLNTCDGVIADEREYGWLMYVPSEIDENIFDYWSDDEADAAAAVLAIWRLAEKRHCKYVLLDQDGPVHAELPTY